MKARAYHTPHAVVVAGDMMPQFRIVAIIYAAKRPSAFIRQAELLLVRRHFRRSREERETEVGDEIRD